jgi:type IV pilus assembly protein PilC
MLFSSRIPTKQLAEFLRRLGLSLESGIEIRKALASEARRSSPAARQRLETMVTAVNAGTPLTEAINQTGSFFPPLTRELLAVGEQTGHLPEVLRQLVEHYDQQISLRRIFLSTISWPMIQLGMALLVVGFLIWVSAVIKRTTGNPTDLLGVGLTGEFGLLIYLVLLTLVAVGIYMAYRAVVTGKAWVAPIQRVVMRIPMLGSALRTLSVARFAWTLHIALGAALDVQKALSLAIRSTHNIEFTEQEPRVQEVLAQRHPIHEALDAAGTFPMDLVRNVEVGEESGRLVETLGNLAKQQHDVAHGAFAILAKIAGWLVWCIVTGIMIALIFRFAGMYIGGINQALKGLK